MGNPWKDAWYDLKEWLDWKIDDTVEQPSISNMATRNTLASVKNIMADVEASMVEDGLIEGEDDGQK